MPQEQPLIENPWVRVPVPPLLVNAPMLRAQVLVLTNTLSPRPQTEENHNLYLLHCCRNNPNGIGWQIVSSAYCGGHASSDQPCSASLNTTSTADVRIAAPPVLFWLA
ncbi:MAG: hypothetical protein U0T81_14710 [Saprospiraceae bacterium]